MDNEEKGAVAAKIVAVIVGLAFVGLYLFPWLLPLVYEMPEGSTLPYYALLVAIEISPTVARLKNTEYYLKSD
jgi:hypothetical protein